ncbi:hypothetical protein [Methylobacterium sp. Leaf466]|uniref:hypothetical protein n=1 Tax=Methylobacterium sp. Leaf466 TaxID=1736386 RepID=UPI0006F4980D|nr:hypothetical protein [Methylobacterium sp. Leaf466]KQT82419.1 hypothetical protein ASG59_18680 [Methylobacterium sp. Leaf466]
MNYRLPLDIYRYTFQPDLSVRPETVSLYLDRENRKIERSIRTLADALAEVRIGTSDGTTVTLANTGVEPGVYLNATIAVQADGRIASIEAGVEPESPIPLNGVAGQYLAADGVDGVIWRDLPIELPDGGTTGQVLTRTDTGLTWTTIEPTVIPPIMYPVDSADLIVAPSGSNFSLRLRPTGAMAGTYSNPSISCDASGRIIAISEQDTTTEAVPVAFCSQTSAGISDTWRLVVDVPFSRSFDAEVAFIVGGEEVEGVQTRTPEAVTATFPAPVDVQGVRITATTADGALISGRVQQPDGGLWTTAFEMPRQAEWTAGETRFFTIGPSISLVGDVIGTGATEITTRIADTGVEPGTYEFSKVTVGSDGRITAIEEGEVPAGTGGAADPNAITTSATWQSPDGSLWTVMMSNAGAFVIEAVNTITSQDGTMILVGSGTDYLSY